MSEFFKAMAEFKPTPKKKHYFKNTEVTLKQYQEIQFHGEDKFEIVNGKVQRKKIVPKEQNQTVLVQSTEGFVFKNKDPYWVEGIGKEGYTWKTK